MGRVSMQQFIEEPMSSFSIALVGLGAAGLIAAVDVAYRVRWISRQPVDNPLLLRISGYVADGAMAFLKREYSLLVPFLLLVAVALVFANRGALRLQAVAFVLGIVLFSGSLFLLALSGIKWLGAITPLGGVAFILGWSALIVVALKRPTGHQ